MKLFASASAILVLTTLCGCASAPALNVGAYHGPFEMAADPTYAFDPSSMQQAFAGYADYQRLATQALTAHGLREEPAKEAHYLVTLAYDARAQAVQVHAQCEPTAQADCGQPIAVSHSWFAFGPSYLHTLSVRFADRKTGKPAYKVVASRVDKVPDIATDMPQLMADALQQLPLDTPPTPMHTEHGTQP